MRISGGRARGIPLRLPRGADIRPATDRLRQGVFSSLGARVEGAVFFDLFAGTGSYGLEALSRGAAGGVFVERSGPALAALRQNLTAVCRSAARTEAPVKVVQADALVWAPSAEDSADVIFADPPFAEVPVIAESLLRRFAGFLRQSPPGIVVLEMPGELEVVGAGWKLTRRIGKGRGQPTCCFYVRE